MVFQFNLKSRNYKWNSDHFSDVSIQLMFDGQQPNPFGVEKAVSRPYKNNDIIGDTRLGGSCNFDVIELIPHCNGTHTECLGHISNQRISIHEQLKEVMIPATLISIETSQIYAHSRSMICKNHLEKVLTGSLPGFNKAIVIRTSPNKTFEKWTHKDDSFIPFMSKKAISFLNELKVDHLLVDFPSIDPMNDGGKLEAHREFWNIGEGSHFVNKTAHWNKTITELIYVPNELQDGPYLLNLQIAPFASDASPSRPILFPLVQE